MNTTEKIIDALLDRFGGHSDDDKSEYYVANDGNSRNVDTIEMYWHNGALTMFAVGDEITRRSTVVRTKADAIQFVHQYLDDSLYY